MPRKTKMNTITSPELLAQVNPKNAELLNEFIEYLRSVGRSEGTIEQYLSDIQIAFVWCVQFNDNKFFVEWTKRNIIAYQNWLLNNNGNSPARIRRLKASLSSMSNYICNVLDDEFPSFRNIINKVESPANQPVREKTILSEEDVCGILDMLVEKEKYEMACYFALAAYSGRRKSELCRFRVSDFDDDKLVCGGSLWKSDPIKTKGRGSGKYLNCYTLTKKFRPYLELWMQEREKQNIESEWLFPHHEDASRTLPISTVDSWMSTISRLTGKEIYIHCMRHHFTTSLARSGLPDGVIQEIIGWTSGDMVRIYKDLSTEEQLDQYFDADGIKAVKPASLSDL